MASPPFSCFQIALFACSVLQGSGLGTMELAVTSTEVRPRPSQEDIEQATWWLFQAWLGTMVTAFMLGAVCWHRCGPRLCQWRREWGQTTPISMGALARAWEPQRGWRPQIKGRRNSEYNTFGECCGRKHSHRGSSDNSDQRTRKSGQNRKSNFQASPGSGESRGLDIPEPWRRQIQASENQRGRVFRIEREDLTKSSGGNNAGGGEPGLEPNQTDGRAKRGAIRIATEKARCPVWVAQARKRLRGKFFSANTAASKNSKRNKVWEIAKVVAPSGAVLPLCVDTLEATAATLLESGLQAADQYLGELKAMHIEEGHWWSDKLNHHLTMCKRALSRGKGPEKRAKELRTDRLSEEKFNAKACELEFPERPGWAYVWATCWMLRAVEAVQVEVKHLTVNTDEKTVKLFIPKSKMDQAEKGTFRTLGCCGKSPCKIFCAWRIAEDAIEETKKKKSKGKTRYLFPTSCGEKVSQFNLIRAWQTYLDEGLTGHSARRSGAMQYTRLGMSVPEISFLGRWKSSAVFRYIEEALQELPANQRIPIASDTTGKAPGPKTPQVASKGRKRGREEAAAVELPELKRVHEVEAAEECPILWAISRGRNGKTAHVVAQASWNMALEDWHTACGWHFARANTKVELTKVMQAADQQCKKCKEIEELRDGVKGGFRLAQLLKLC